MSETYDKILALLRHILESHPETILSSGADFNDVDDEATAMSSLTFKQGSLEVRLRLVEPAAARAFEWVGELTFIPPEKSELRHFLLRRDGSIVEAYGKHLLGVDEEQSAQLLARLQELE